MSQILLVLLMIYAACGLVLSAALHALAFVWPEAIGHSLLIGLMIGVFPLWLPVTHVMMKLTNAQELIARQGMFAGWNWKATFGGGPQFDLLFSGCPAWMRYAIRVLMMYALLNFVVTVLIGLVPSGQQYLPGAIGRLFSSYAMAFYGAGLATILTVYRRGAENLEPRCSNGHRVVSGDRFCATCGAPISEQPIRALQS